MYSDIPHTGGVFLDRRHQDKAVIRGHYSQEIRGPVWQQQSLRAVLSAHQDVGPIYEVCGPMHLRWCPWQQRSAIWYRVNNKSGLKGNWTDVTWPTSSSSDKRSSTGASRFVFTANQVKHGIDKLGIRQYSRC